MECQTTYNIMYIKNGIAFQFSSNRLRKDSVLLFQKVNTKTHQFKIKVHVCSGADSSDEDRSLEDDQVS